MNQAVGTYAKLYTNIYQSQQSAKDNLVRFTTSIMQNGFHCTVRDCIIYCLLRATKGGTVFLACVQEQNNEAAGAVFCKHPVSNS